MYKVKLYDGKYEVVEDLGNGIFKALRYGEEWRNLNGDKLILALVYKIQELEEQLNMSTMPKKAQTVARLLEYTKYKCPQCENVWNDEKFDFCPNCGQKLDWI